MPRLARGMNGDIAGAGDGPSRDQGQTMMAHLTKAGKEKFIRDLCASVQASVLAQVANMPDDWDGFELRQYLADKFEDAAHVRMDAKRKREYKNTVAVRNL